MYFINIFIYSDESGVFDKIHNDYFVFGGLICIGKESKDIMSRKYSHAENVVRETVHNKNQEIKASTISNKNKGKLFRSLNECHKFGVIIKEKQILESIYGDKKSKQRYLDFAYKIAVKKALENLIKNKIIVPDDVENIYFYVDEHATATNGLYELNQCLEPELIFGTFTFNYDAYYPPLFPKAKSVVVQFCNSSKTLLVRAADIIANRLYNLMIRDMKSSIETISNMYILELPPSHLC